ncbi:MAG: 2-oxoacid:acceptor oxidoreductase family protein [Candidatus Bathyarchaeales archaeon]
MFEVRWHGRGGQGAWTASELLARAAIYDGKYVQSFPEFGPERMGAPVTAFTRISTRSIRIHCAVYKPDAVAVLDATLLKTVPVTEGLKRKGVIIINSKESPLEVRKSLKENVGRIWTVPATEISIQFLGAPMTSTAMLGALARVTGIVGLDSVKKAVEERFKRSDIVEKNFAVIKEAYEKVGSE